MHRFIGAGAGDRRRILDELGLDSVDQLFDSIPVEVTVPRVDLADGVDEDTMLRQLSALAEANVTAGSRPCFLGAGVYRHVQPAVVDAVVSRGEYLTSYTPYQAEITQGTLQAIFEFQTLICQLTGLDVANASLYDGATSMVEAVLMGHRVHRGKRSRVVLSESVHPVYRSVLEPYAHALDLEVEVVSVGADGRSDAAALEAAAGDDVCAVVVQSPSFLGVVEDLPALVEAAGAAGALTIQVVCEATSLGLLSGGGDHGFDVVCGEAQAFGLPASFGGPHLGFFATTKKHMRQIPGRLVGQTVDAEGERAFCLTLSTREQHIRRAKATSNICTNHGLMALAATVWLEAVGGRGFMRLARDCYSRTEALRKRIDALDGWAVAYPSAPVYNELLVTGPKGGEELARELADAGILAGVPARRWGGSWPDGLLVACTERTRSDDVDALIDAMGGVA